MTQIIRQRVPPADKSAAADKTSPAKNLSPIRICVIGEMWFNSSSVSISPQLLVGFGDVTTIFGVGWLELFDF
jgi:hypothetical protein